MLLALKCIYKCILIDYHLDKKEVTVMNSVSSVSFRIDSNLKSQADALFASLGLNMTTAFNMFLRQSVREGKIPFEVTIDVPNAETIAAMIESLQLLNDPNTKTYPLDEALDEMRSWEKEK